jgi:hypothetical protein
MLADLAELLAKRAASLDVSPDALWNQIARYWTSPDHVGAEGMSTAFSVQ